jgi:hypothetical protein
LNLSPHLSSYQPGKLRSNKALIKGRTNTMNSITEKTTSPSNCAAAPMMFIGSSPGSDCTRRPFGTVLGYYLCCDTEFVLLWLRGVDNGFTVVMAVLPLLSNIVLVVPFVLQKSDTLKSNPWELVREIQHAHETDRKRWEKARRQRRRKASQDPEDVNGSAMYGSREEEGKAA